MGEVRAPVMRHASLLVAVIHNSTTARDHDTRPPHGTS